MRTDRDSTSASELKRGMLSFVVHGIARRVSRIVILMSLQGFLLSVAGLQMSSNAAGPDLPSAWTGFYCYPSTDIRAPVPFKLNMTFASEHAFYGSIDEPAKFGKKQCDALHAYVQGEVDGTRIRFIKTYDGSCGETHSLKYYGILDPSLTTIWGCWSTNADWASGGNFIAQPDTVKSAQSDLVRPVQQEPCGDSALEGLDTDPETACRPR